MSSILTNNASMVALQTLRNINNQLNETQNQISTGKKISSAKDNAAIFAITKVMEADVAGFEQISSSLSLGEATVSVAANAAERVGDLLNEIKSRVVAANEDNVDSAVLQEEISSLRDQVSSIVGSAQFNGLNLIDGSQTSFDVLSSLTRDSSGIVSSGNISLNTANANLSATSGTDLDDFDGGTGTAVAVTNNTAGTDESALAGGYDNTGFQVVASTATLTVTVAAPLTDGVTNGAVGFKEATAADLANSAGVIEGDRLTVTVGSITASYTVRENDQAADIAAGMRQSLTDAGLNGENYLVETNAGAIEITNNTGTETRVSVSAERGGGALSGLQGIDVSTGAGAATALGQIENAISASASAQATIGTVAKRLEIQSDFLSSQIDAFKSGIGALVDADMEETSARLQALQVQQQLGVQALSIANQAPQTILALFR